MDRTDVAEDAAALRCRYACRSRCCRYITVGLPAPRLKADFDELSWFLAHEDISVYVEGRRWHLEVRNRCKYLTEDGLCEVYDSRPGVCREHEIEECEYPDEPRHALQFDTREQFDEWWRRKRRRERLRRERAKRR